MSQFIFCFSLLILDEPHLFQNTFSSYINHRLVPLLPFRKPKQNRVSINLLLSFTCLQTWPLLSSLLFNLIYISNQNTFCVVNLYGFFHHIFDNYDEAVQIVNKEEASPWMISLLSPWLI